MNTKLTIIVGALSGRLRLCTLVTISSCTMLGPSSASAQPVFPVPQFPIPVYVGLPPAVTSSNTLHSHYESTGNWPVTINGSYLTPPLGNTNLANVGNVLCFHPDLNVASYVEVTFLLTNRFDSNGQPLPGRLGMFIYGWPAYIVNVESTNGSPIVTWTNTTPANSNWTTVHLSVPTHTNEVARCRIRIYRWIGQSQIGSPSSPPSWIGGITWRHLIPPLPFTPEIPPIGELRLGINEEGNKIAYYNISNPPVLITKASVPGGPYSTFSYELLTNYYGTNIIGAEVPGDGETGFFRLETP